MVVILELSMNMAAYGSNIRAVSMNMTTFCSNINYLYEYDSLW